MLIQIREAEKLEGFSGYQSPDKVIKLYGHKESEQKRKEYTFRFFIVHFECSVHSYCTASLDRLL